MDSGFFPESTPLGRYEIVKRLGGGETSEVVLAVSHGPHGFERTVVLKRLLPRYQADTSMGQRLATEAVAYARLTHPAIVRLYDFFDLEGQAVLVVEYVDGPSLRELQTMLRARRETLSDPVAFYIASRVFAALAAAHSARDPRSGEFAPVIHCDVSPGSVLLPWDGFVKLGDFGFAKVKGLTSDVSDTRHGLLKGTVGYMAPEQVLGETVTARTDVYAACLLLRELLLATPTFAPGVPELEALRAMAETELPPIETLRGGLSPAFAAAMRRGLARDPEARTLTAAEMVGILRRETDLARAQTLLETTLARFRSSEARASTPPAGTRAFTAAPSSGTLRFERMHVPPEAMPSNLTLANASDSDSYPTLRHETPNALVLLGRPDPIAAPRVARPRPRARPVVAPALLGLAACVVVGLWLHALPLRRGGRGISTTGAVVATDASAPSASAPPSASSPPAAPVVAPSDARLPAPAPASTLGELVTPPRAHSHRVFVDGHYAAPRSGATLSLPCGEHTVRIGSKGKDQRVSVPCGGSIHIDAQ
jgi:serine/threonine-protein kinase